MRPVKYEKQRVRDLASLRKSPKKVKGKLKAAMTRLSKKQKCHRKKGTCKSQTDPAKDNGRRRRIQITERKEAKQEPCYLERRTRL